MKSLGKSATSSSEDPYLNVDHAVHRTAEYRDERTIRGLGTGAIAAPMAVSFREEKLAQAGGTTGTDQLGGTSFSAGGRD